jgi:hypothetical protein
LRNEEKASKIIIKEEEKIHNSEHQARFPDSFESESEEKELLLVTVLALAVEVLIETSTEVSFALGERGESI